MKNRYWLLFIFPFTLAVISLFLLGAAVKHAKFHEEWAKIKKGINNIADNSLIMHELYGNEGGYLRSNQTVHTVHLFMPSGLWIAQYIPHDYGMEMVSNPGFNSFSRFNPMAYTNVQEAIKKEPSGEFRLRFTPENMPARKVFCYFRWVYHEHEKTGEVCNYLIVVASSLEALQTIIDPSVAFVYAISLSIITAIIIFIVLTILKYEIYGLKIWEYEKK